MIISIHALLYKCMLVNKHLYILHKLVNVVIAVQYPQQSTAQELLATTDQTMIMKTLVTIFE